MFAKKKLVIGSVMKSTSIWELVELFSDLKYWNFHSMRLRIPGWGKLSVQLIITVLIQRNKNLLWDVLECLAHSSGIIPLQCLQKKLEVLCMYILSGVFQCKKLYNAFWSKWGKKRNEIIVLCLSLLFCEALWKGIQDSTLREFWKLNFGQTCNAFDATTWNLCDQEK